METSTHPRVVRFGVFEVDKQLGELRKFGLRVRLQDQPFQILNMLLERSGELVTREEIRKKLWPADTFVDFDHGLNNAINRLREALGDSADTPRYIETLPKKGYRFIAPVSMPDSPKDTREFISSVQPAAAVSIEERPLQARSSGVSSGLSSRRWIALVAVGVLVTAALLSWFRLPSPPKVTSSSQITRDGLLKTDLLTDGARLYFTEIVAGHNVLSQVSVAGGETSQIPTPFTSFRLGGLSPNGAEIMLAGASTGFPSGDLGHEFPLWVLPLPTGAPHRVGDLLVTDASWSRDGQRILYTHGHDLYLSNRDGMGSRRLASVPHYPLWARWSPRGEIIRFTEYDLETNSTWLWEVAADGSGLHRLLPQWSHAGEECCGNWIAGGKYYLFQSAGSIWILHQSSGLFERSSRSPVQLVSGPLSLTASVPSNDGHKLFVVGQQKRAELLSYNANAGQFVPYLSGISGGQLDFSRDGHWIAYIAYPDETLWRSRLDGSDRQQLTYSPLRVALPRWSPDGKRIAFMAAAPIERWKIFLMTVDDGHMQDVLPGQGNVGDPSWSPDGTSLAFASLAVDANSPPAGIELLDLRSNQISFVPGSEHMFSPRWSPDGRFLAGITADSDKLTLFDFSTQKWSTLATHTIGYPTWSKDSKYIFFDDSSFTENPVFYRVNISGHNLQRVVSLKDVRQFATEWPFGSWTGLTPDDAPLVQRDISTQEIYALDIDLP